MTNPIYRIKDWDLHFENDQTRGVSDLDYVPMPNRHDGDGYTELIDHKSGAAYFGLWCAIVEVASKCKPRGTLIREGNRAHDSRSLSRQTGLPKRLYDSVFPRLLQIGWLETVELQGGLFTPGTNFALPVSPPETSSQRTARISNTLSSSRDTDLSKTQNKTTEKIALRFDIVGQGPGGTWDLTEAKVRDLQEAFPGVDILLEAKKARLWCINNPTKRKTARGMPDFLFRWMTKAQNRGGTHGFGGSVNGEGGQNRRGTSASDRTDEILAGRNYEDIGRESLNYYDDSDSSSPGSDGVDR